MSGNQAGSSPFERTLIQPANRLGTMSPGLPTCCDRLNYVWRYGGCTMNCLDQVFYVQYRLIIPPVNKGAISSFLSSGESSRLVMQIDATVALSE